MQSVHLAGLSFHVPAAQSLRETSQVDVAGGSTRPASARRTPRRAAGQGMTEYIVIVALIAVAAIGIYTLFGQTLRNQTAGLAQEVSGQDASTAIGNAQTTANNAQTSANTRKGLDNYNASNRP